MDLSGVRLLLLEQGEQTLEDHTRTFLDITPLTHFPDNCLCSFYQASLNAACRAQLSGEGPRMDFAPFVEWVLASCNSSFTVCLGEDLASPTPDPERDQPPSRGTERPHEPSPSGATEPRLATESDHWSEFDQVREPATALVREPTVESQGMEDGPAHCTAAEDESTSVGLCGIHQNYDNENKRRAYPWLAQISVARSPHSSNCMGSLVTSTHILTAAHCFKEGDTPDKITVTLGKEQAVKVEKIILHPDYDITAKQHMGIKEYYEFDAALIQLNQAVMMSVNLRPICIPCTKETNGALKLSDSEGTCKKHEELLMRNELVEAAFTSKMDLKTGAPRKIKTITIKRGKYRDACVEDAKKVEGITVRNAKDVVTDNFLCSGGTEPQTDDIACKDETGGATHVNRNGRLIQVGVVSWGVKDICAKNDTLSEAHTRDYHTNLFSDKIQSFLKEHLGNDAIDQPLLFF